VLELRRRGFAVLVTGAVTQRLQTQERGYCTTHSACGRSWPGCCTRGRPSSGPMRLPCCQTAFCWSRRRPVSDRPRPGRHSPLAEPSLNFASRPGHVRNRRPVSAACFDSGPLRLSRGVGHTLRQIGPPVRSDRAAGWDSLFLAISEMTGGAQLCSSTARLGRRNMQTRKPVDPSVRSGRGVTVRILVTSQTRNWERHLFGESSVGFTG
jgi:hypothetical protein